MAEAAVSTSAGAEDQTEPTALQKALSCSVCKEAYKTPKTLTCTHVFCVSCIEASGSDVICPQCKWATPLPVGGVAELPNDVIIQRCQNIKLDVKAVRPKETYKSKPKLNLMSNPCDFCPHNQKRQSASVYCNDCNKFLCEECNRKHGSIPVFRGHSTVSFDGQSADQVTCTHHKMEPIRYLCSECNSPLCVHCVISHDPKHDIKEYGASGSSSASGSQMSVDAGASSASRDAEPNSAESRKDLLACLDIVMNLLESQKLDPNFVYSLIEARSSQDRFLDDIVAELSAGNSCGSGAAGPTPLQTPTKMSVADALMRDVQKIKNALPSVSDEEIYAFLEAHLNEPNRVKVVTDELSEEQRRVRKVEEAKTSQRQLEQDIKFSEIVATVLSVLPECDTSCIEAEFTNQLMSGGQCDANSIMTQIFDGIATSDILQLNVEPAQSQPLDLNDDPSHDGEMAILTSIFPDCDPTYIQTELLRLIQSGGDSTPVNTLTAKMLEDSDYPKISSQVPSEKTEKPVPRKNLDFQFRIKDFMEDFDGDPVAYFSDIGRSVSDLYTRHCKAALLNHFSLVSEQFINKVLRENQNHLFLSFLALETAISSGDCAQAGHIVDQPRLLIEVPDEPDDLFFQELIFCKWKADILSIICFKKEDHQRKVEEARNSNSLHECGCCYDDELLFEDMLSCPDGHLFCAACVRRSTEEILGQGRVVSKCLDADCEIQFPLQTLKLALKQKTYNLLVRKTQESEIEQADIEDLVKCPFCSYAAIMPDLGVKVLQCQNPDCLKDSCRFCQEPSHVPYACGEVEKQGETDLRTMIEMRASEAMLRTCHQCQKRFYKTEGCNMMTCPCGAKMCYVCRQPIRDYSHFGDGAGRCAQFTDRDMITLHRQEIEKALLEAKQKYANEHPEATDLDEKFSLDNIFKKKPASLQASHGPV